MLQGIICLNSDIHLRQEYFGGLVYNTRDGTTLEVDKSAFQFLNLITDKSLKVEDMVTSLAKNNTLKGFDKSIDRTLQKLFELNIIKESNELPTSPIFKPQNSSKVSYPWLSAPETVHWAITYRCDQDCPDCYARRFFFTKDELDTSDALKLIDKIAGWNVFQLAIGGGEPFAREDLQELIQYAAAKGLSVHITTGKSYIPYHLLKSLAASLKILQIGVQTKNLIGPHSTKPVQQLKGLLDSIQSLGVTAGANLFLSSSVIEELENFIKVLVDIGFKRIILLRYKPPESIERWRAENPDPYQMRGLYERIDNILKENPGLNIRVDCSLSFVQRNLPMTRAAQSGIKGCVAANRILALAPDGSAYPCSQLVYPDCCCGNLLETEPEVLWNQSRIIRKYRFFRTKKTFTHSWCGVCLAKERCGGCRIFAADRLGGDSGCPEPLLPPITQLGKIGRSLDLPEYLASNYSISVGGYMDRYRVGQRKAIKELNASPYAVSTTGKSARKKRDVYEYFDNDIDLDIQDIIGYSLEEDYYEDFKYS